MADYVAAQASVLLVPSVKGFRDKLKAALSTIDENVKIGLELQEKALAEAAAEIEAFKKAMEKDKINLEVDVDTESIKKKITEIRNNYQDTARDFKKALVLDLKIEGLSLLPQLGTALASLDQSVVALSQSALLLPGIFAGLGSSLATVLTGTHGVAGAFKDFAAAQKDSTRTAAAQRDALRSVDQANRDLARSTKDAKRNLEDLNDQMRDAPLDEAEAVIRLQEARTEAAQRWGKTALQQQKDALAVEKAESALAGTRKRNIRVAQDAAEANAKGVAGADAVVSATERLQAAQEKLSKGDKFSESFAKLGPEAQRFVTAVTGMKDQWSALQNTVSNHLFANMGNEIRTLAASDLPLLERGFGRIADGVNSNMRTMMKSLGSDSNKGLLDRIFGNTGDAQARLSNAINPMLDAFLRLSAVGGDFLPRMANGFTSLMTRFDEFIKRAEGDGSLKKWMEAGMQALKDLGNSLINIGSIMNSVSDIFTGNGGRGFLQLLEHGTKRLADFLKTTEGQNKLQTFFRNAHTELDKFSPILKDLWPMFKNLGEAVKDFGGVALPIFGSIAQALAGHPALAEAVVFAFAGWKNIKPIISGISGLLDGDMVKALKNAASAVGGGFKSGGLTGALSAMSELVGTGGPLAIGIGALVGVIGYQWVQAQQDAATAVAAHADELHRVNSELDQMTGAMSRASGQQQLKDMAQWGNPSLRGEKLDIPTMAEGLGIDRRTLLNAVDPSQQGTRNDVLSRLDKLVDNSVESKNEFKLAREELGKQNVSPEVLTRALAGDKSAIDQVERVRKTPGTKNFGDLNYLRSQLSDESRRAADVGGVIRYRSGNNLNQGDQIRKDNAAVNGNAFLKPGTPFDQLGSPRVYPDGRGGADIQVDTPFDALPEQLRKDIEANGGSIEPMLNGSKIHLNRDRANLYVDQRWPGGRADGGHIRGPGHGTSDSILARLSNGEFVMRAASVSKYGTGFMSAINAGAFSADTLPAFKTGGLALDPALPNPFLPIPGSNGNVSGPGPLGGPGGIAPPSGTTPNPFGPPPGGVTGPVQQFGPFQMPGGITATPPTFVQGPSPHDPFTPRSPLINSNNPFNPPPGGVTGPTKQFGPFQIPQSLNPKQPSSDLSRMGPWWEMMGDPRKRDGATVVPRGALTRVAEANGWVDGNGVVYRDQQGTQPTGQTYRGPGKLTGAVAGGTPHGGGGAPGGKVNVGRGGISLGGSGGGFGAPAGPVGPMLAPGGVAGLPDQLPPIHGGSEAGMQVNTIRVARAIQAMFPFIASIGGYREPDGYNEHSSGQAADIMLPDYSTPQGHAQGQQILSWVMQNAGAFGVDYVIFDQAMHYPDGRVEPMKDRGSDNENHRNHLHVHTNGGGYQGDVSTVPAGLTGFGGGAGELAYSGAGIQGGGFPGMSGIPGLSGILPGLGGSGGAGGSNNSPLAPLGDLGGILLQAVLGFFGINGSTILGPLNKILGGIFGGNLFGGAANDMAGEIIDGYGNPVADSGGLPGQTIAGRQYPYVGNLTGANTTYNPQGGVEQWRPLVTQLVQQAGLGPQWVDPLLRQIGTESGGNPNSRNDHDSNGQGGTQTVAGLLNFLPATFSAYGGTNIWDPADQIRTAINYVSKRYGETNGAPNWIGQGHGFATGGLVRFDEGGPVLPRLDNSTLAPKDIQPFLGARGSGTAPGGPGKVEGSGKRERYKDIFKGSHEDPDQPWWDWVLNGTRYLDENGDEVPMVQNGWGWGQAAKTGVTALGRGLSRSSLKPAKLHPETRWGAPPRTAAGKVNLSRDPSPTLGSYMTSFLGGRTGAEGFERADSSYEFLSNMPDSIPGFEWLGYLPQKATGGLLNGPGNGTSDSMLARVSNGEFVMRAAAVDKYGAGFMRAVNEERLPGFAEGDLVEVPGFTPPTQSPGPLPGPSVAPGGNGAAGGATAPAPVTNPNPAPAPTEGVPQEQAPETETAMQAAGKGVGVFAGKTADKPGAGGPSGSQEQADPRSTMGGAPTNSDHTLPALSKGIQGAAGAVGGLAAMAASMGINAAAPGAGSAAGSGIQAGAQIAGQAITGAVNILASLGVGTLTPGTTAGAYGTPLLPQQQQQQRQGPTISNTYGDIHTASYDEFYRGQQRREAQQQAPFVPMR